MPPMLVMRAALLRTFRGIFRGVLTQRKQEARKEISVPLKFHALKTFGQTVFRGYLSRMLSKYFSPLTKREIRMQGPFLVSTEPSKTRNKKFTTTYREPTKDLLAITNVVKLLFGLVFLLRLLKPKMLLKDQASLQKQ
ncbi:uncharacterized protein [Primulina eburnea]|uniref:uncharacterized protein n=1 Tax=Primulina eburnea TaxID=1245227 RepID=UPI003C6BE2CB